MRRVLMVLALLAGTATSAAAFTIDPAIAGHWQGAEGGIAAMLDLSTDGVVSGTLSGGGKDGCTFRGAIGPDNVLRNKPNAFAAIDAVEMSGCVDATLNQPLAIVLSASPQSLTIAFIDPESDPDDAGFLFKIEGMARTGPLGAGAPIDPSIAGSWSGSIYAVSSAGASLSAMSLEIAANGTITGSFAGTSCIAGGSLESSTPDEFFSEDLIKWRGTVSISACTGRAASFNGVYHVAFDSGAPFTSIDVEMFAGTPSRPRALIFGTIMRTSALGNVPSIFAPDLRSLDGHWEGTDGNARLSLHLQFRLDPRRSSFSSTVPATVSARFSGGEVDGCEFQDIVAFSVVSHLQVQADATSLFRSCRVGSARGAWETTVFATAPDKLQVIASQVGSRRKVFFGEMTRTGP